MNTLGIETSCDETAAALVSEDPAILSNVVASSVDLHREYGGIVPEIAARAHVESIVPVLRQAMSQSDSTPGLVAVTVGPGLAGSLLVGVSVAKGLAWSWEVPLVAVNHLEAHAFAPLLEGRLPGFPFLALVVSGGHTLLAEVQDFDRVDMVGETLDDALGEAYDKVSMFLGTGYPGGPVIDSMAAEGNGSAIRFPRPMIASRDLNFSLSGLKTAVVRYVDRCQTENDEPATVDVAASFQEAALEVIVVKTVRAALDRGLGDVVMGGGVACNSRLRQWLDEACGQEGINLTCPSGDLCTDNAAMVAALGYRRFMAGERAGLDVDVYPGLMVGRKVPAGQVLF